MKIFYIAFAILFFSTWIEAQGLEAFELDQDWISKVTSLAPENASVEPKKERKVLVFSLHTGFKHWVIPHSSAVIKILGDKTKAFKATDTKDISFFEKGRLEEFDAIVLNNTCSDRVLRDLFWDKLGDDKNLSEEQRKKKAKELENNLLEYVRNGGGLMVMHGAIVMQNNSTEFGEMVGGSFDYHPPQQEVIASLVDDKHPLVAPFDGEPLIHIDEPYFFNNAYFDYNFRPLLSMDVNTLESLREEVDDKIKYISWIKKYGEGRVYYVSPSHNAQSMENPKLLKFYLNGLQYALGDLECDDSPIGK